VLQISQQTPGEQYYIDVDTLDYDMNYINIADAYAMKYTVVPIGVKGRNLNSDMWYIDPTWDGGGGDNLASTAANWVGDAAPGTNDVVTFDNTSDKDATWDLAMEILPLMQLMMG
jgi:hypothetical protein